jgi:hypothetical protein
MTDPTPADDRAYAVLLVGLLALAYLVWCNL